MGYLELGILAIPKIETISTYDINEIGDGFHQYDDMILDDLQERLFRNVESELERNAINRHFCQVLKTPGTSKSAILLKLGPMASFWEIFDRAPYFWSQPHPYGRGATPEDSAYSVK